MGLQVRRGAKTGKPYERVLMRADFAAQIFLYMRNGRIEVSESIRFRFTGSWNGVYRDIPVVYETPGGFNLSLLLAVTSVTGEDGEAFEYEESREGLHNEDQDLDSRNHRRQSDGPN